MNKTIFVSLCTSAAVVIGLVTTACGGQSDGEVPAAEEAEENAAPEMPESEDPESEDEGGEDAAEESGGEDEAKAGPEADAK